MSKERAQRRAVRLAAAEAARVARERKAARRARRKAVLRAVTPRLPDRRVGRLTPRRSRFQRITIALLAVIALVAIWLEFDDLATRIAFTVLIAMAGPALIVLTLDRR